MATRQEQQVKAAAPAPGAAPSRQLRLDAAWSLIPAAVAIALFLPIVRGDFIYDDHLQIQSNTFIRQPALYWRALWSDVAAFSSSDGGPASPYWRPTFVAWMIVHYALYGAEHAAGWRASNVLLHALAAVLAFAVCRRLGLARP